MVKKIDFPLLCLSLIPVAYVLKGALPFDLTLVLYLVLYAMFFYKIWIKKERLSIYKADILWGVWIFIMTVGACYSPHQMQGLFKVFEFVFLGCSLILFSRLFVKKYEDLERILRYLLFVSVGTGYLVLVDFYLSGMGTFRYQAFGKVVPIPLSMLGATTMVISLLLFLYKEIRLFEFVVFSLPGVATMAIAASKGPVVALVVTLILAIPVLIKRIKLKRTFIVAVLVYALTKVPFIADSLGTLTRRFSRIDNDMSTSIRIDVISESMDLFSSNPILGMGTAGTFPEYPHNLIVEILSENGLVLLMLFALIAFLSIYSFVKYILKKNKDVMGAIIYSLLSISMISLMFSFTYVDHKYLFLSFGLLLVYAKIPLQKSNSEYIIRSNKRRYKRYKLVWSK